MGYIKHLRLGLDILGPRISFYGFKSWVKCITLGPTLLNLGFLYLHLTRVSKHVSRYKKNS